MICTSKYLLPGIVWYASIQRLVRSKAVACTSNCAIGEFVCKVECLPWYFQGMPASFNTALTLSISPQLNRYANPIDRGLKGIDVVSKMPFSCRSFFITRNVLCYRYVPFPHLSHCFPLPLRWGYGSAYVAHVGSWRVWRLCSSVRWLWRSQKDAAHQIVFVWADHLHPYVMTSAAIFPKDSH